MQKRLLSISLALSSVLGVLSAQAQDFNARQGLIAAQPFVTRISTPAASRLLGIVDIDQVFFDVYFKLSNQQYKGYDGVLPSGVSREGNTLVLQVPDKPPLRLTDSSQPGKSRAIREHSDTQHFTYLMELPAFHVLAVSVDRDRPSFMLVDKASLQVYFITYDNL